MRRAFEVTALIIAVLAARASAAEPDLQARSLFHYQDGRWAGWSVGTDWTAEYPRILTVFGPMWRQENKEAGLKKWLEVMAGGFIDGNTVVSPALNVRAFRSVPKVDLYLEETYNFRTGRWTLTQYALFPAGRLKIGIEAETTIGRGEPALGIGPRAALAVPCGPLKCAVAVTYFFGTRVVRTYVPVTYVRQ